MHYLIYLLQRGEPELPVHEEQDWTVLRNSLLNKKKEAKGLTGFLERLMDGVVALAGVVKTEAQHVADERQRRVQQLLRLQKQQQEDSESKGQREDDDDSSEFYKPPPFVPLAPLSPSEMPRTATAATGGDALSIGTPSTNQITAVTQQEMDDDDCPPVVSKMILPPSQARLPSQQAHPELVAWRDKVVVPLLMLCGPHSSGSALTRGTQHSQPVEDWLANVLLAPEDIQQLFPWWRPELRRSTYGNNDNNNTRPFQS